VGYVQLRFLWTKRKSFLRALGNSLEIDSIGLVI